MDFKLKTTLLYACSVRQENINFKCCLFQAIELDEELVELTSEISLKQKLIEELENSQKRMEIMKLTYENKLQVLFITVLLFSYFNNLFLKFLILQP